MNTLITSMARHRKTGLLFRVVAVVAIFSVLCEAGVTDDGAPEGTSLPSIYAYRALDMNALRKGFATPPREAGPWVYWMFFENVMSREEITRQLEELAAAGFAGAELRFLSLYGFSGLPGPEFDSASWKRLGQQQLEYLSPEFVEMLEHACAEASRVGLRLAINMGMGWPPGGPWITEEHRSKHLTARDVVVQGPVTLSGEQAIVVSPTARVYAWKLCDDPAVANSVLPDSFRDLGACALPANRLEWEVPAGRWLIGIFECVPGGLCDKGNGPEADPGSREAVLFHFRHIFDRLQPRLGKYFGSTLVDVTSDSWEYERRSGARYWSPSMWTTFTTVAGYELPPRSYALLGYGPDRERTLVDLERVEKETIRCNFFETAAAFLHARGLRHRAQVRGRGLARDLGEAFASLDIPEIEEEVFLPEAVWVAHTGGKPIIGAEAFTFLSGHHRNLEKDGQQRLHEGPLADPLRAWETNLTLLRWHASAHFARGINRIQMHSFGYSPCGVPPPGWRIYAEVHLNRNVPWWPYIPQFNRWIARNQWVLQAGSPVADALVYPVRSNAPEGPYNLAADQPAAAVNALDGASRQTLTLLGQRGSETPYEVQRLVLLDDVSTPDEVRQIGELMANGTVLVCCQTMPEQWSALRPGADAEEDVERLRRELRKAFDLGQILDARLRGWQVALADAQTVRWSPASAQLSFQHRRVRDGQVYLVTNWGEAFSGDVSFPPADLMPEIWDADTGAMLPAGQYRTEQGRTVLSLSLGPHESALVAFTPVPPQLHAVRCHGGRVAYEANGSLVAQLDDGGPCHVELDDGRTRALRVALPEPLSLDGSWTLTATQGVGLTAPGKISMDKLVSWRDIAEWRTWAGTATYETQFAVPAALLRDDVALKLELGEVYELADVWLNGRHVATSWFAPHCLDVTCHVRPGQNTLRIDVPNILKNHLETGDYSRPSGLLGPVQIRPVGRVILEVKVR